MRSPPKDHHTLRHLLDRDWARLLELSGEAQRPRGALAVFSPRFASVWLVRYAHAAHRAGWRRVGKLFSLANFLLFGIEVPARVQIGPGLVLPHPQGTILGAAYIGADVTIYQQVTLGAKLMDFQYDVDKRPFVGDGVTITAGAKVLGPVTLGENAVVGANAVVLVDVPANATAIGVPARVL